MTDTVVIANSDENAGYRFSWGLAIAGGVTATAVTFLLLTLGSGFGLLLINPIKHTGPSLPAFLTGGAIYFFAAQAFGFAAGGHLTGRLLGPQIESHLQEDVRAAAHGLVTWAVTIIATILIVALAGLTAANTGAGTATLYGAISHRTESEPTAYLVDELFRPADEMHEAASATSSAARGEAGRILDAAMLRGEQMSADDHARLSALVSRQAGIPFVAAEDRVNRTLSDIQTDAKRAADVARKTASYTALWLAFAMLFGAIVAAAAAVFAREEDDRDALKR
jgi:hypothetical protein